ncbi:MAG TPA: glycosyltransferase family 2 protein [Chitinophagaceae bacterium]|nr:glycosyltransferase family 2 protein [Chitinophagaceae bacterium]
MEGKPLVSVLMTAYNREKYIAEAIESVLSSSYKNFELIIVDDCSTDRTVSIARSYEVMDSRVKVFRNEKNLTQFGNRNKSASYATGEYLKFVDSDDIIYPYTLQMMVDGMQQFPDAALGFCLTDGHVKKPFPYLIEPYESYKEHFSTGGLLFVGPSGLIIKRSMFEEVNGFEEFGMPSDNHLTLKIAAKYPVIAFPKDLFWWRVHDGQVFMQNKKNHYNILNNYNYCVDIISNYSPLEKKENSRLLKIYNKIFWKHIINLALKKTQPLLAMKIISQRLKKNK